MRTWRFLGFALPVCLVLAVLSVLPTDLAVSPLSAVSRFAELPNLLDVFTHRVGLEGQFRAVGRAANGDIIATVQKHNYLPLAAENKLRDCFAGNSGTACTTIALYKYHGIGTGNTAAAEGNTGCGTELTTEYTGNVRATGSQVNSTDRVYSTVGTNTLDSGSNIAVTEFCLMDQAATGGGNIWSRVVFGAITLSSGDSLQTTYSLTLGGPSS